MANHPLIDWINNELEIRDWTYSKLAARAELSTATVSEVISGKKNPGLTFCTSVARALQTPPENVLRLAGLLPPLPEETMLTKEVIHVFHQLDDDQQQEALAYLRWMRDRKNQAVTKTSTA